MCGRFTIAIEPADLQSAFNLKDFPTEWQPRYNVAPSQVVPIIRDAAERKIEFFRWGLVPLWAKDPSIGSRMINARSESLQEKPSFRNAFQKRRCLILADGFYEWQKFSPGQKTPSIPYRFVLKDRKPFAFAGLWESWMGKTEEPLMTCTIITTQANAVVAPIHERMPVMLDTGSCYSWLEQNSPSILASMLRPFPDLEMEGYQVSKKVNSPNLDGPECLLPEVV